MSILIALTLIIYIIQSIFTEKQKRFHLRYYRAVDEIRR